MTTFYSAKTGGFYPLEDRAAYEAAGKWPEDGVEISSSERAALLAGEANGQRIAPGENGKPILVARLPPDIKVRALAALTKSDITIIRCAESNTPVPAAWATYRQALRAIIGGAHADALPAQPAYPA